MSRSSSRRILVVTSLVGMTSAATAAQLLSPNWSVGDLVKELRTTWMGGTVSSDQTTGRVRRFDLHIEEVQHTLADGVSVKAWAFGLEGQPATVPGPSLRVREGDTVVINVKNNTSQPHSVHSHGITGLDELNDGVPHISGAYILPGKTMTYQFVAKEAGTHWYHCHVQTSLHQSMGMYGSLIVEDKDAPTWDREFVAILGEWDTKRDLAKPTEKPNFNYYLVNGKVGNEAPDMKIEKGQVARIRLINAGFQSHALHLHGTHFVVTHKDGYQLLAPYGADTLDIAPGETYDVFVKGRDGTWPWHDHNSLAATNDGVYPGGMLMHVRGSKDEPFDAQQAQAVTRLPLEGAVHGQDGHAAVSEGDPDFIKELISRNAEAARTAPPLEQARLQAENLKLASFVNGTFDAKTGAWTFSPTEPGKH
ncbi:multicopper oxidase family protein [Deinococcus yavapaiensis]|uniref:Multicopper oxidase n=1 Tax=Deinococcus yavapaiensis KR-236 TaxID=694435 RepID=A0A318S5N9_9DEIO|nr:multicopper oxidase domain-containing protein [Deinococcus yavapaiensis]PYE53875.1 multicopper oxidase [Deinococcus yavapaiensis KR-236]